MIRRGLTNSPQLTTGPSTTKAIVQLNSLAKVRLQFPVTRRREESVWGTRLFIHLLLLRLTAIFHTSLDASCSHDRIGSRVSQGVAREERRCGVSEDFRSWRSSSRDVFLTAYPLSTQPGCVSLPATTTRSNRRDLYR